MTIFCASTLGCMAATGSLSLKDIANGQYAAETMTVTPMDGDCYAMLSDDGRQVVKYSYKTGRQVGVLFDAANTVGRKVESIDGFELSPDGTKLLLRTATDRIYRRSLRATYYIYTIADHHLEPLSDGGPQQAPVWSPDSKMIAFAREGNLFLIKLLYDNAELQVTNDGQLGKVTNGVPDWVYEEEFGINKALTFTADAQMLCWVRYDESQVATYSLEQYKGLKPEREQYADYPGTYTYKYPKAGYDASQVSVRSYDVKSRQTRTMQIDVEADGYIPRLTATDDGQLVVMTMNRHQDRLDLWAVNPRSTMAKLLIRENGTHYVKEELLDNIKITSAHILLPSDRSGTMQLYLYSITGQLQRRITDDRHYVTAVYGNDAAPGHTNNQAAGKSPMNREVYATHRNGKTDCLAGGDGWNSAAMAKSYAYFLHAWSDRNTPYRYALCDRQGKTLAQLTDNRSLADRLTSAGVLPKEFFTLTTSEGVTLNGVMIKPKDFNPAKKYPVDMWQYSGPGSQQVVNSWDNGSAGQGALFDEYMAQQGYIMVCVDGRGTGARGADFEKCTYMNLGALEAKDQVEAALWLAKQSYVDKDRIGIWGWSYGGFCTLMSMSEGRPAFRAGVAVAAPTDWRYYDNIYTERYMRTPKENATGYNDSPIARASQLSGSLLLCHGLADDNVHPQNLFEYTEALVQADKDFTMNVYTNRNHSIYGGNTRHHLLRQIVQFFNDKLK